MPFNFSHAPRGALVTGVGAADGIGFAIAHKLAECGIFVRITSTSARVHQRSAELRQLGWNVSSFVADMTSAKDVETLAGAVGDVDILVNNAGLGSVASPAVQKQFVELNEAEWDAGIGVSLKTAFLVTRTFLPPMTKNSGGRIINIASVTGPYVSNIGESTYSAAKAGMVGLTHALAVEVASHGITVNAVAPGWIQTGASTPEEKIAARNTPPGRAGRPDEVAAVVEFLASREASYVNGAVIVVDGGNILQERKGS